MKNHMIVIGAMTLILAGTGPAVADSSNASSNVGGGMPSPDRIPHDKQTDLTKGQGPIPDEYATEAVQRGSLKDVPDSKWLNQSVSNKQGQKLGTIKKVMRDDKTQKIEFVFFEVADSRYARPMRWSQFEQQGDKLVLNATREELLPSLSRADVKDMSPDLAMYMDDIESKREESKPFVGPGDGRGTNRVAPSSGPMGEDKAAGNLGDRGGPPGQAPGFKDEAHKKAQ
ncbi:MAG TPA: PRC-barrel domain-containing protein [Nitrospira sp.]